MSEREYDDEEVAAIFQRAASPEHASVAAPGQGKGLTLAALQEIGREVGIAPESIASAAISLEQAPRAKPATVLGVRIGVVDAAEFDRPISDPEWERLVSDLRTTFDAAGVVRYDGPFRQWSNGNLKVLAEPTATGHRLRFQTVNSAAQGMIAAGLGAFIAASGALLAAPNAPGAGAAFLVLGGAAALGVGWWRLKGWATQRQSQFAALVGRYRGARILPPGVG